MVPNIYVIGAQSTGKTTLVNALEAYFADPENRFRSGSNIPVPGVVREVARSVLSQHNFSRDDIRNSPECCLQLQQHILEAQWQHERHALSQFKWFISDRSGLDPIVYAKQFAGGGAACSMLDSEVWHELRVRMKSSIVVVCDPNTSFLNDDGVRLMPQDVREWEDLHNVFCDMLKENGVAFILLGAIFDPGERLDMVKTEWKARLSCERSPNSFFHLH